MDFMNQSYPFQFFKKEKKYFKEIKIKNYIFYKN